MDYLTLDELIHQLQKMRNVIGRGDIEVRYSVNMGEYEGGFERVVIVNGRDEVFLDDGSMEYDDHYVIVEP